MNTTRIMILVALVGLAALIATAANAQAPLPSNQRAALRGPAGYPPSGVNPYATASHVAAAIAAAPQFAGDLLGHGLTDTSRAYIGAAKAIRGVSYLNAGGTEGVTFNVSETTLNANGRGVLKVVAGGTGGSTSDSDINYVPEGSTIGLRIYERYGFTAVDAGINRLWLKGVWYGNAVLGVDDMFGGMVAGVDVDASTVKVLHPLTVTGNTTVTGNMVVTGSAKIPALAAALDASGNRITGLPTPQSGTDAARLSDISDQVGALGASFFSGNKVGLLATYTGNTTVTVAADAIDTSTTTMTWRESNVSLTCNLATSGLGGLDTGSISNSTFYDIVLSAQYGGGNPRLIAKVAGATLTKPAGYVTETHICYVLTDGSAHVRSFWQVGQHYFYDGAYDAIFFYAVVDGTAGSYSTVSLSSLIPPGIREAIFTLNEQQDGIVRQINLRPTGAASGNSVTAMSGASITVPDFICPISASRQVDYIVYYNNAHGANLVVSGWVDPK